MSITCGHCKGQHTSVAAVKACALPSTVITEATSGPLAKLAGQHSRNDRTRMALGMAPVGTKKVIAAAAPKGSRPFDRPAKSATVSAPVDTKRGCTDAQAKYLLDLIAKKAWEGSDWASIIQIALDHKDELTVKLAASSASNLIEQLKAMPYRQADEPASPTTPQAGGPTEAQRLAALLKIVPNGGYAVEDNDGVLHFFVVKIVHKDSGRRGVRERASDTLHSMYRNRQVDALRRIVKAGLKAAAERYAEELGICYVCSRTLTDETSRALGIGPICRQEGKGF